MRRQTVATSLSEDLGSIGLDAGRLLNLTGRGPSYHQIGTLTEQAGQQDRLELTFGSSALAMRAEDLVRGVAPYSVSGDGLSITVDQGVPTAQKSRVLDVLKGSGISHKTSITASESTERAGDPQLIKSLWGNVSVEQLSEDEIDDMLDKGYAALDECDPLSESYEAISGAVDELLEYRRLRKVIRGGKRVMTKRTDRSVLRKAKMKRKGKGKKMYRLRKRREMKGAFKAKHRKTEKAQKRYGIGKFKKSKKGSRRSIRSHVEPSGYGELLREAYSEFGEDHPFADAIERIQKNAALFVEEFDHDPEVVEVMEDALENLEVVATTAENEQEFFEGIKPILNVFKRSVEILSGAA